MAKKDKEFRLCYVHGNIMWFTDNFEGIWGDDWNDTTYITGICVILEFALSMNG